MHPDRATYSSFCTFKDPDGNNWLVQEVTARLPGRGGYDQDTTFTSASELAATLRRAATAHGEHEKRNRRARCELADLVRRIHRARAGGQTPAHLGTAREG